METHNIRVENDKIEQYLSKVSDRKIFFSLCEKNSEKLKSMPHRLTVDGEYAMIYRGLMERNSAGHKSLVISNIVAEKMELDESRLYDLAMKNTPEIFPAKIVSIENEMKALIKEANMETESLNEIFAVPEMKNVFIVSNENDIMGAGSIYYDDHKVLNEIAEKLQQDLIVLPSSVHEVIVIPDDGKMKVPELKEMINEANLEFVEPKERLGWNPLRFDRECNVLSLAEERKEPVVSRIQKRESIHRERKRGGR